MVEPQQTPVRERILDAAMSLLRDKKAKKIAQPQVARLAGVPQGHLTYYFPKKLDLLIAVTRRYAQAVRLDMARLVEGPIWRERDETERRVVMARIGSRVKDQELTRMLLRLMVEGDADPDIGAEQGASAAHMRSSLARLMGRPEADPDVDLALAIFWGLSLQHMVFGRSEEDTDRVLARMRGWMDLVWGGEAAERSPAEAAEAEQELSE